MDIRQQLMALGEEKYADFQHKLTPTVARERIIGVRVPELRKLAKEYTKSGAASPFLAALPHDHYDEDMLHGLLISEMKDYDQCIRALEEFLPHVDNWAVCDIMSPKCFKKHRPELLEKIYLWTASEEVYTCRFGLKMLMAHFLDEDFRPQYLDIPAAVQSDEYYVNMMIAWFFATALAKQWDSTLPYLTDHHLSHWVHNKTIQKARESNRITPEQKELLKGLKI